jgi:hypothetical protein
MTDMLTAHQPHSDETTKLHGEIPRYIGPHSLSRRITSGYNGRVLTTSREVVWRQQLCAADAGNAALYATNLRRTWALTSGMPMERER